MLLSKHIPCAPLQAYISHYLLIAGEAGMDNQLLPDTVVVMGFRCAGTISQDGDVLPSAIITGLHKAPRQVQYAPGAEMLLVAFKPGGPATFFNVPPVLLAGQSIALENFIPAARLREVEERLALASDALQRVAIVEALLLSLRKEVQPDHAMLQVVQEMQQSKGAVQIPQLLTEHHISRDPFEKRFRKLTGISPKQFARTIKLKNLIQAHQPGDSLTQTAYTFGYFDQAHFIKDFKAFTGETPSRFFKRPPLW
jgi:AraC-like DNA-binding protein